MGYDQSPDYGGPPPTWRTHLGLALFLAVVGGCVGYVVIRGLLSG